MIEEIENRRSIRKYLGKPVENEKITEMLNGARLAPSGNNTQPWRYLVVTSEEIRQKITQACHHQKWMLTAPVFIVCVADIRCRIPEGITIDDHSPEEEVKRIIRDTAISTGYLLLQANALGLGTCWVGDFTQEEIRPVLGIPMDNYVVGVVTVGYPGETPAPRPRKKLEEIVRREAW